MLIGSGPIVIGQACEFDYSGTQGVKALKEEGYRVVLVNSNPATIMTDPEIADRTYIEPLTVEVLTIIERERPDALLPTLGGQTALNLALELHKAACSSLRRRAHRREGRGDREGGGPPAVQRSDGEDRPRRAALRLRAQPGRGADDPGADGRRDGVGFPVMLRPSFTLGGSGAAIVWNAEEFDSKVAWGLPRARAARCWSSSRCSAGRNTSWR